MNSADEGTLLHVPLSSAGVSEAFVKVAQTHGFNTLAEIVAIALTGFISMDRFTPEMVEELAKITRGNPKILMNLFQK